MAGTDESATDERVGAAADELYGGEPDAFMARRGELAAQARTAGDPAAAKRIGALRKPTASAAAVNRLVLADETVAERLADLAARLRQAQDELDTAALRELTDERRTLVGRLARDALGRSASTTVRDEVVATLEAALADPDVAARLGRLQRAERWSGFGFGADAGAGDWSAPPELRVVRGGRRGEETPAPARKAAATSPTVPAATRRKLARAVDKAQAALDGAQDELDRAEAREQECAERVRDLGAELDELARRLEDAKREQEEARRSARGARARRREAQSALARAQRQAKA